jgi:hypothetical protein
VSYEALTEDERRELLHLYETKRRILSKESLEVWAEWQLGLSPAIHHKLIIEKLEQLERGDIEILFLFLPPGSAKSSYGSIVFPSWFLGRNPTKSVICASHTNELAEKFGRKVRNIVSGDDFRETFGGISVSKDSSAAGRWETSSGGEFYACGLGGSVTGRRADLGVIDDPVASREVADSELMREKAWDWFKSDFLTRLKPGYRLLFIMTRWHEDDLGGRALEFFGDRAKIVKIPMEAMKHDVLGRSEGERLWSEWFTSQMIEDAKQDPRAWSALYQQEPRPIGGGEFKKRWVNYYDDVNHSTMKKIMLVDSSSGRKPTDVTKKNRNDYTSIWIIGLGTDENYYALDIARDRFNLVSRSDAVFKLHRKWKPEQVRYEQYGMMADIEHIRSEMNRKEYRFPIIEVAGKTRKEDRIRRLVPLMQTGRFWMPKDLWYTQENGEVIDLVDAFVNTELVAFPVSIHDDMLDSLARIKEPTLDLPWPSAQQDIIPEMSYTFNY